METLDDGSLGHGRRGHRWGDELRLAVGFLTRVPVGAVQADDLTRALWAFPIVGAGIGLAGGVVYGVGMLAGLPPMGAVILSLITTALLTGALHEDGLADTADGFGGGSGPAEKLAIMRDSRIGTYGVLALGLVIGLKVTLLTHIGARASDPIAVIAALATAGALSRAAMLAIPAFADPARSDGLGAGMSKLQRNQLLVPWALAAVIAGLALFRFGWTPALWAAAAAIVGAWSIGRLAVRQVGGYTGDVLGAAQQISETAILVALAATMVGANV